MREGDKVEGNYRGRGRWFPGTVDRARRDGTFDINYDDGERELQVVGECVRAAHPSSVEDDVRGSISSKREGHLSRLQDRKHDGARYSQGSKVACYWYRPSQYGRAKLCKKPRAALVLRFNSDSTYTVEMTEDGSVQDDVEETYLKSWAEATRDLGEGKESEGKEGKEGKEESLDKWVAVYKMAHSFVKHRKSTHNVPPARLLEAFPSPLDKLEHVLGAQGVHEFRASFAHRDRHADGQLDLQEAVEAYTDMGARIGAAELRAWLHASGASRSLRLADYVIAYANLLFPADSDFKGLVRQDASEALGRSLRLTGEDRDMAAFAHKFGPKQLKDLEKVFDSLAAAHPGEDARMLVRDLIEAFLSLGRAITVSRLQEWMAEAGIAPRDRLTLADFAAVYAYFFSPQEAMHQADTILTGAVSAVRLTLAEIAVQVLQEERWRGTQAQTAMFVRRLCAGRGDALVQSVAKLRAAFEELDTNSTAEVPVSQLSDVFYKAQYPISSMQTQLQRFRERLEQQMRGTFSLPEVFEHFGPHIQDAAESAVSVAEAFSMMRMHCSTTEVRLASDLCSRIVEGVLAHPHESKFWLINVRGQEFTAKIWQYEGGQALMKAVGFGEPFELRRSADGSSKSVLGLASLPEDVSKLQRLPAEVVNKLAAKRAELDQEMIAIEGAPSVAGAVREMRAQHSLAEVRHGLETALSLVRNVLAQPKDLRMYRIKKANPAFARSLGRLRGHELLMSAIGFHGSASRGGGGDDTAFVLKSVNPAAPHKLHRGMDIAFASTADLSSTSSTSSTANFKFPYLDPETERFLWRRKADLEAAARLLDGAEAVEELARNVPHAAADAAHVSGLTQKELAQRAAAQAARGASGGKTRIPVTLKEGAVPEQEEGHAAVSHLKTFLAGATAAQRAQIAMIRGVFERMDADRDGLLSMADVRAYFRAIGRNASDLAVRRWITARDVDQDGTVSLTEFVGSYALQLDPASQPPDPAGRASAPQVSALTEAFGALRLGGTALEVAAACEAADGYLRKILDSPGVRSFWSVHVGEESFHRRVGRLFAGTKLMQALGFQFENNGTVLAIRDPKGKEWDIVPQAVRVALHARLEELHSHRAAILEPSISNIAAVSSAIGNFGDTSESRKTWVVALETILKIVTNILRFPDDPKYYSINVTNPAFHAK
ncbi:hypothetical protein B484DRAFT_403358 [Ochromonadaceae sp. CCMP2298]|nr:hypothetical protein B484DRAFT_403358 [Ochromonadaceae sp. CCMP2298]